MKGDAGREIKKFFSSINIIATEREYTTDKFKNFISIMKEYISLEEKYSNSLSLLRRRYSILSMVRLLLAIIFCICFYYYTTGPGGLKLGYLLFTVVSFLIIIRIHRNISGNIKLTETLLNINKDEITFLKHEGIPFADGSEFIF